MALIVPTSPRSLLVAAVLPPAASPHTDQNYRNTVVIMGIMSPIQYLDCREFNHMKDENGLVLIKNYYQGINFSDDTLETLNLVPDNKISINKGLLIHKEENESNYQETLQ